MDPGGYPAEDAFDEVREIARKALAFEQTTIPEKRHADDLH